MFFQKTPFLTFEWLGALFVIAPLDCVAHGRHDCCFYCDVTAALWLVGSADKRTDTKVVCCVCDVEVEEGKKKSCSVKRTARESSLRCAAEIKKGRKAEEKAEKKGRAWRDWRWGTFGEVETGDPAIEIVVLVF